jgi:hypothetical protein
MSVEYKYKPDKHKFRVNLKTIDEMHKEHLDTFKKNRDAVPAKNQQLKTMEKELKKLEQEKLGKPVNLDVEFLKKRNTLRKDIKNLKDEINQIDSYKAEMNYYSRTGDVIYDYYNLTNGILYAKNYDGPTDQKDRTKQADPDRDDRIADNERDRDRDLDRDDGKKDKVVSKIAISDELMAITNLNRLRKIKKPIRKRNKKVETAPVKNIMSYLLGDEEETKDKEETKDNTQCRATLQNEYLLMMDKEYACSKSKISLIRKCKKCSVDKVIIYGESIMTCPKCGESEDIFIESDIPSHRETFTEKPKYPYKRKGHCIEKLNQFLCKGTANIPTDVFTTLEEEVAKHGLEKKELNIKFLEKMLKKHRMSDYYEYIMFIYSKMTGTPPQTITREEYELVLKMFEAADEVYEKKFKPKSRNNFLKYTFVLNKIFLTIGRKDIAQHFKLLKSPLKMKEQERIWNLICNELEWKYHCS